LVYLQQNEAGEKTNVSAELLRGHLAVLFGLLMRESSVNERIILEALPGERNSVKVESLLHEARDFVNFYDDLTSRLAVAAEEGSKNDDKSPADFWIDSRAERMIRDSKSQHVVHDVISFLATLCNRC
jgi:hypothetical protein